MMFGSYGDIVFESLTSPEEIQRQKGYKYAQHDTIAGIPKLQYIGTELEEITLRMHFHGSFCDVNTVYDKLIQMAEEYKAYQLIIAGQNVNKNGRGYVIESIRRQDNEAIRDTIIDMTIEVRLKEYAKESRRR